MITIQLRPILALPMTLLLGGLVSAQDLSDSSRSSSAGSGAPVGAEVAEQVQAFAEGVPELQQTDRATLRDSGNRGGFVGADTGDTGFFGEGGTTGTRRTTGRSSARRTSRQSRMQPRSQQTGGPTIRPTLTLGFRYTPKPTPNLAQKVTASLSRVPQLSGNPSIRISVNNTTVILEGNVPTPHDRALSEQIAALSPGVTKIENRLAVESPTDDLQPSGR